MAKILLHTCCGPCFLGVWEDLGKSGLSVTSLFYNPNIQPQAEYLKRKENLQRAALGKVGDILEIGYDPEEHAAAIQGQEAEFPKRCLNCYRLRLREAAREAKEKKFDLFSTTLLISPYQQHEELKKIGQQVGEEAGIEFYYQDWRPNFREGQRVAKEAGIYRQKYCGCRYSKEYK
jgi:predicted adenine nucleotide alpha hydrolase (AANH) superfamily ATPase